MGGDSKDGKGSGKGYAKGKCHVKGVSFGKGKGEPRAYFVNGAAAPYSASVYGNPSSS